MARNSETTTNGTPYVEKHGPHDRDHDVALRRRSSSLTTARTAQLPPRGIVAMLAAVAAAVVTHGAALTHNKETLGQEARSVSSQHAHTQAIGHPRQQPPTPTSFTWTRAT